MGSITRPWQGERAPADFLQGVGAGLGVGRSPPLPPREGPSRGDRDGKEVEAEL